MEKRYDSICPECVARFDAGHSKEWIDIRLCGPCSEKPRRARDGVKSPFAGISVHSWDEVNPKKGKGMRKVRCAKPHTPRPTTLH